MQGSQYSPVSIALFRQERAEVRRERSSELEPRRLIVSCSSESDIRSNPSTKSFPAAACGGQGTRLCQSNCDQATSWASTLGEAQSLRDFLYVRSCMFGRSESKKMQQLLMSASQLRNFNKPRQSSFRMTQDFWRSQKKQNMQEHLKDNKRDLLLLRLHAHLDFLSSATVNTNCLFKP